MTIHFLLFSVHIQRRPKKRNNGQHSIYRATAYDKFLDRKARMTNFY
ncbi:YrzI family small protein [Halobacillus naozhouensis]|uniref:YrzI family small protein n=1 Tax=Halobacillus naozhouensis TaxID=554880 RepID=A0ABY8J2D9_9BACI|nr:YrzI family small protein [Halobacillus naozhouensis]WFT76540.1 YrzI family small protein [Halobacillus naozhouensis]